MRSTLGRPYPLIIPLSYRPLFFAISSILCFPLCLARFCPAKCGFTTVPHIPAPLPPTPVFRDPVLHGFLGWQNNAKMVPTGTLKITKNDKNRKKRVPKGHLNSIHQKTSKITDFGRVWDLPDRAETRARASFSLIRLGTKTCPKLPRKAPILEAPGTPKSEKARTSDLRKKSEILDARKRQNGFQKGGRKC